MTQSTPRRTLKELLTAHELEWLVRGSGSQVLGPVSELMLLKAVLRGGIDEGTLVHPVGQPQWRPIREIPRLARALERLRTKISGVLADQEPALADQEPARASAVPHSRVRDKPLASPPGRRARASGE